MLLLLMAYTPSYSWPTLGYDRERSSYQMVPGANLSSSSWVVKWRVPATFSVQRTCGAVLKDVRGDYPGEEVILNDGANIQCRDGNTGSVIWSHAYWTDLAPNSTPAVGDVDGDGVPEILVCQQQPGVLFCLNGTTGSVEWRDTIGNGGQVFAPVCLADLDNNGNPEIIVGTNFGTYAYCYNGDGTLRWQSDALGSMASVQGITAGDVTGDGVPEILVSVEYLDALQSNAIICLNSDGTTRWAYPDQLFTYAVSLTTPAIGDVNGGAADVIVGRLDNSTVSALQGSDGSTIWTYNIPNNPHGNSLVTYFENLAAYDVDGDGRAEVYFGVGGGDTDSVDTDTTAWQSYIIGLDNNGSELFRYMIDYWSYDGGGALCDIDNDGRVEFMKTADDGFFYVFDALTGALEWSYDFLDEDGQTEWSADPPVAVGDIDGDACSEVVLVGPGLGGDYITALDGPGTDCLLGAEEMAYGSGPRLLSKPGMGVLWLRVDGFSDAKALVWDASGRRVAEIRLSDRAWTSVELSPGIYFVKAVHQGVVMRGKALVY